MMANLIGRTFGNYQIIEQIGVGGMATVYKAYQSNMDRYVAIKVLPEQLAKDPEFLGRFEQEARTIARLENKHILPVYDYGAQDGIMYLVMRYIGEGTLKDLTQQGPVHLARAVDFLTQIAEALQYAHDRGVIHRDIKTSNVLIGEGSQCYLTDFGIAKLAASSSHFTSSGAIIGTPAYMSPEQCNGLPADARSDLYALGIVLYEMLTGRVPFEAETPIAVVRMQIDQPLPSPRSKNPNVPEAIEKVTFRALAKDPENRYASVREFAGALTDAFQAFTEEDTARIHGAQRVVRPEEAPTPIASGTRASSSTRRVHTARPRRWLVWLGAVVLISLAIIVVGSLLADGDDSEEPPVDSDATMEQVATSPASSDATSPAAAAVPVSAQPAQWTTFTRASGFDPGDMRLVAVENGLWMTSKGGLVHWNYDGTHSKITSAEGLAFNSIRAITVDSAGAIWLGGGETPGLMRLTTAPDGAITGIDYYDSSVPELESDHFWAFLQEPDGTMLVGAYESYLEAWNGSEWVTPDVPVTEALMAAVGDRVWDLERTAEDTLWAAGPRGLARRTADAADWQPVPMPDELLALNQESYGVAGLYEDPLDGVLWVVVVTEPDWALHTWQLVPPADSGGDWSWRASPDWWPDATALFDIMRAKHDNALWVVTYNQVLRHDPGTGRLTVFSADEGIPGEPYFSIAEAPDGGIWLATSSALVNYTGQRWVSYSIPNEPPGQNGMGIAEADDGTLWFIADWGNLFTYHDHDGVWKMVEYLDADLRDIVIQGDTVWIASGSGLIQWQNHQVRWYTPADGLADISVHALTLDAANPDRLWIGTERGLNALDISSGTFTTWTMQDGLTAETITALYSDPTGVLWIGTGDDQESDTDAGQVAVLRTDGDRFVQVGGPGNPFAADDRRIFSLAGDGEGRVWVGTDSHLYRLDGTGWQRYSEEDGAPEWSTIQDIQVDGGVIWFATHLYGLYRLDSIGWLRVGREGIGSELVHDVYRASDGALWILTENGITRLMGDPYQE